MIFHKSTVIGCIVIMLMSNVYHKTECRWHFLKATLNYVIYNIGFFCARALSKHIGAITLSDLTDTVFL